MKLLVWCASLLVCLLLAAERSANAADLASCAGVVLDENGIPIGDAQLKFQDAAGHVYKTETDGAGRFALRNLPAAEYKVEVRKEGYFVLANAPATLQPGANTLHLTLNHAQEVHEQVQVTAGADQIDPQDTSQHSTLTARDIRDIPTPNSHVLSESLATLPEVTLDNSGNLHVAGARSGETQYLLDGFEISDPTNGTLSARFNIDATRAADIQAGRVGAEYAHSGANVLNLATPDGDDRWRFGTTNPVPGINVQEGTHLGNWYPRFTFSGPIIRGKFWFSDSISIQHIFDVVKGLPTSANTSVEWAADNLLRLQYNFNSRHILHGSFLYNRAHIDNLGLDALDPDPTTTNVNQERYFGAVKDQIWLHDTLLDFGFAADYGTLDYIPQGTLPYVLLVNGSSGNYFQQLHQSGRRLQAIAGVTAGSRHWHGTHQIMLGANLAGLNYSLNAQRGEIQVLNAFASDMVTPCSSVAQAGCLVRQTTFAGPANPAISNTQAGGYVQDTWSFSKFLVLQAGLRTDWDRFTQTSMAEPRFSANVLPFGDDQSKISLGWGIYNVPLNLSVLGQAFDQQQIDFFPASNTTAVSRFVLPADGVQQPRFTNFSAGWQQKMLRGTLVGLELLARNGYHGFAYVDQQPTVPGGIFLLEDHRKDRYRAATISARHIFSEDTQFFGAYTRSVAHSNQVLSPALGSIFYVAQQAAPTAWDAPNRVVSWGWLPTHIWSIELTYFLEYRTGFPYSVINLQQQLVGPPNALRFPDYASLNLGIERKFGFRGYLWGVRVEAINILDRQNPNVVVNNVDAPNFGTFEGGQGRAFTLRVRFIGRK